MHTFIPEVSFFFLFCVIVGEITALQLLRKTLLTSLLCHILSKLCNLRTTKVTLEHKVMHLDKKHISSAITFPLHDQTCVCKCMLRLKGLAAQKKMHTKRGTQEWLILSVVHPSCCLKYTKEEVSFTIIPTYYYKQPKKKGNLKLEKLCIKLIEIKKI